MQVERKMRVVGGGPPQAGTEAAPGGGAQGLVGGAHTQDRPAPVIIIGAAQRDAMLREVGGAVVALSAGGSGAPRRHPQFVSKGQFS